MAQLHAVDPQPVGAGEHASPVKNDETCEKLVLDIYSAVMSGSRNERSAFDAAVKTYRSHKTNVPEPEARLAVARILCGKP